LNAQLQNSQHISPEYRAQQEQLHATTEYGTASIGYAPVVTAIINRLQITHLLDYGCAAKCNLAKNLKADHRLQYQAYDPAVPRFAKEPVPKDKLDSTRSRLRYGFALGMNSSDAIAGAMAGYIGLRRTPLTIDKLFALYDTITPEDMRQMAAKYFVDSHRTIVTLSSKKEVAK